MTDASPQLLGGRYEVRSLIGRGGMAQVHLGRDTRLSRLVAIKMLRIDLARDSVFQTRFRREAQAAASLNHPNIVAVYDTGEEAVRGADGKTVSVPYIVMEYVEGHTVKELISDGTPVPIPEAVEITSGVLSALQYAHAAGLVHRDIKPGNVMLTDSGKVKVMDFGIARALADSQATMTQTNAVIGTAAYLSPEQAKGETVDERSDIYSAGCMLYELLTGKPPFEGENAVSLAYQHVSETPAAPSSIAGDIPVEVEQVTMKALAKNPDDRYANASDMEVDLVRASQGMTIQAPPIGVWDTQATQQLSSPDPSPTQTMAQQTQAMTQQTQTGTLPAAETTPAVAATTASVPTRPKKKSKASNFLIGLLILLAAALVGGVIWLFVGDREPKVEMTVVPDGLVGMNQAEAKAFIEEADLIFKLGEKVTSEDIEEGLVAEVNPPGGTELETGSEVEVALSAGPSSEEVPDMSGWTRDQVDRELKRLGLLVGTVEEENDPKVEGGRLIRSSPAAGSVVPRGESVNLWFSSGNVEVPNTLIGQTQEVAVDTLRNLKFQPDVIFEQSSSVPQNTVIRVEPLGLLKQGSTVRVYVSSGPPAPQPPQSG